MIKLKLIALELELIDAFKLAFKDLPNVEFINDYFQNVKEYDCLVSPANSFGLMDGGMDQYITEYFGKQLQTRVQKTILEEYGGEQPVGTSFIVDTKNIKHPFLAHTPTMRVPLFITSTDVAYYAMKATLLAISKKSEIQTLLCPGFGTGCGKIDYGVAARQMAVAYKHYLNPIKAINWTTANKRHEEVMQAYYGDALHYERS